MAVYNTLFSGNPVPDRPSNDLFFRNPAPNSLKNLIFHGIWRRTLLESAFCMESGAAHGFRRQLQLYQCPRKKLLLMCLAYQNGIVYHLLSSSFIYSSVQCYYRTVQQPPALDFHEIHRWFQLWCSIHQKLFLLLLKDISICLFRFEIQPVSSSAFCLDVPPTPSLCLHVPFHGCRCQGAVYFLFLVEYGRQWIVRWHYEVMVKDGVATRMPSFWWRLGRRDWEYHSGTMKLRVWKAVLAVGLGMRWVDCEYCYLCTVLCFKVCGTARTRGWDV